MATQKDDPSGNGDFTVTRDGDDVVIRVKKPVLEAKLLEARLAQSTPEDIATILALETIAFAPPDAGEAGTMDPPETEDGVRRFLEIGGETILLYRAHGFLERAPLSALLTRNYSDLSESSPLRQIAERRDLLSRAADAYRVTGKDPWYVHGFGIMMPDLGDGKKLVEFVLFSQIRGLVQAEDAYQSKVQFGYVDIGPKKENVNGAAFRLFNRFGAVMDGFEPDVYVPGVPYVRVSQGTDWKTNPDDHRVVPFKRGYLGKIERAFSDGYIGTAMNFDSDRTPVDIVFERKVA